MQGMQAACERPISMLLQSTCLQCSRGSRRLGRSLSWVMKFIRFGMHVGPLLACSVCVTFIPKPIAIPNVLSVLDSNWMNALIRSKFK